MSPVDVTASLLYTNNTNVGAATADASYGGDANHDGSLGAGGFTIAKAPSAGSVDWTGGAPHTYPGAAQTPCTASATGAGLDPGAVPASPLFTDNAKAGSAPG